LSISDTAGRSFAAGPRAEFSDLASTTRAFPKGVARFFSIM
jgi:hypothetical protein